jgi:signal transduction histidine kinase
MLTITSDFSLNIPMAIKTLIVFAEVRRIAHHLLARFADDFLLIKNHRALIDKNKSNI